MPVPVLILYDDNGNEISIPAIQGANGAALIRPTIEEVAVIDTIADDDRFILNDVSATIGTKTKYTLWSSIKTALSSIFAPLTHASRHATNGDDAISPSAIGAAGVTDGVVTATQARVLVQTKTASFELGASDAEKLTLLNSSSAIVVTFPLDATYDFPIGTAFNFIRWGSGTASFAVASGGTLTSVSSIVAISATGCAATAIKVASNSWWLICG